MFFFHSPSLLQLWICQITCQGLCWQTVFHRHRFCFIWTPAHGSSLPKNKFMGKVPGVWGNIQGNIRAGNDLWTSWWGDSEPGVLGSPLNTACFCSVETCIDAWGFIETPWRYYRSLIWAQSVLTRSSWISVVIVARDIDMVAALLTTPTRKERFCFTRKWFVWFVFLA